MRDYRTIKVFIFLMLIIGIGCTFAPSSLADTPPIPKNKTEALDLDKKLEITQKEKQKLEKEVKKIHSSLSETREELVDVSRSIQREEKELSFIEYRIGKLEMRREEIFETLQKDRQSIARLVQALGRLRRIPPEAMIIKPGEPIKTAQTIMLLRDIIPSIHKEAEALKAKLAELEDITSDLKEKHEIAWNKSQKLQEEHETLSALVKKREVLYSGYNKDLKDRKQAVQKISAQARNLKDLVNKLEQERERTKARDLTRKAALSSAAMPVPPPGSAQLPLSGIIKTSYNQPDSFGAKSQGLHITGRGGALVVAPMGGTVRFAGHFKNYGNMVIIEHNDGYHSLVAGLEKIDTVVGQNVGAGEPLGLMHHSTNDEKPVLYYELRYKGKPVNPARKFSELG